MVNEIKWIVMRYAVETSVMDDYAGPFLAGISFSFFKKWNDERFFSFYRHTIFVYLDENITLFCWSICCVFFFLLRNSENTKIKIHTYTQGGGGGWWNVVNIFFFFSKENDRMKMKEGPAMIHSYTHHSFESLLKKKFDNKKKFFCDFF